MLLQVITGYLRLYPVKSGCFQLVQVNFG